MSSRLSLILVFSLLLLSLSSLHATLAKNDETKDLMHEMHRSLKKALNYMEPKVGKFPLDSTFGITAAAQALGKNHPLGKQATLIARKDLREQKIRHPHYYSRFHKLADRWFSWGLYNEIQQSIETSPHEDTVTAEQEDFVKNAPTQKCSFKESVSDDCLKDALKCKISKKCVKYEAFAKHQKTGYCLTHQILYYEFIRRYCPRFSPRKPWATDVLKLLSRELLEETKKVKHTETWSDYWIERYVLGLSVGAYKEFVDEDVIRYVLRLQLPEGCWEGEKDVKLGKDESSSDDDLIEYDSGSKCAFHTTGLVIYYLGVSLSFLHNSGYDL